jgi:hypothetical protein
LIKLSIIEEQPQRHKEHKEFNLIFLFFVGFSVLLLAQQLPFLFNSTGHTGPKLLNGNTSGRLAGPIFHINNGGNMRINLRLLLIPFLFVFVFAVAGVKAQHQRLLTSTGAIEVVDDTGTPVLTGVVEWPGGKLKTRLVSTGVEHEDDAYGTIEIENDTDNGRMKEQKITLKVRDLEDSAHYTVLMDGVPMTTFTTNQDGDAEVKIKRKVD